MASLHHASDSELIRACRRGELAAWDVLVARYEALLLAVPLRMGLSRTDAEDVAQNTLIALLNHLDTLREENRLAGWLTTTAKREAWLQQKRRNRFAVGSDDDLAERVAETELPEETLLALTEQHLVRVGLERLQERCQQLLTLLYVDQPPRAYQDVAQALGVPLGSIGPQRARCLEKLRKILEELGF